MPCNDVLFVSTGIWCNIFWEMWPFKVGNFNFSPPSSVKWHHSEDMTSLRIWASPPTVSGALDIRICSAHLQKWWWLLLSPHAEHEDSDDESADFFQYPSINWLEGDEESCNESKSIVFDSCLKQLFQFCRVCGAIVKSADLKQKGSLICWPH